MFDLSNLNDYEFELLCKDIWERKLNIQLHTFSKGPDGGIDICDSKVNPKIVIQVKHYISSKYSDLKTSLKKEIEKVSKINPESYYICSSLGLTKKNKDEIFHMFEEYMCDNRNVLDKSEINAFLEKEENQDIVKKNYKLWLCASNVLSLVNNQNVFIDCDELMCDIEKDMSLFVETNSYFEAKRKLIKDNIIIIIGAPGVGKSTISKMLVLYLANEEYTVRYTTDNNISDIKKVLSQDPAKKEVILLDDFLGQHYLKINERQPNELKTLISFIRKNQNKKLILNSRITILNEAMQSFLIFKDLMENHETNTYLIDLDKMGRIEKARILYNHLYFNHLPRDYFLNIKSNKNYYKIIMHKNYNPRIIEYVTKTRNYDKILATDFFEYINEKLNNPEDVWRDEFQNRFDETDRILVNTLYSLTNNTISSNELEKAFNKRIRSRVGAHTSINTFKSVTSRLTNSILKNIAEKGIIKISVINPSINDYVFSEIKTNTNEQIEIMETSVYIEQVLKVASSIEAKDIIKSKIMSGEFLKMQVLQNSVFYYYLKLIIQYKVLNEIIQENVRISFERASEKLSLCFASTKCIM